MNINKNIIAKQNSKYIYIYIYIYTCEYVYGLCIFVYICMHVYN